MKYLAFSAIFLENLDPAHHLNQKKKSAFQAVPAINSTKTNALNDGSGISDVLTDIFICSL